MKLKFKEICYNYKVLMITVHKTELFAWIMLPKKQEFR